MKYDWKYNSKTRTVDIVNRNNTTIKLHLSNRYRGILETEYNSYFFKSDGLLSRSLTLSTDSGSSMADVRFNRLLSRAEIWYKDSNYTLNIEGTIFCKKWSISSGKNYTMKGRRDGNRFGEIESEYDDQILATIGLHSYLHYCESVLMLSSVTGFSVVASVVSILLISLL